MKILLVAAWHAVPWATAGRPYKFYFQTNDNYRLVGYFRSNPSCQFAIDATEHENLTCSGGFAEPRRAARSALGDRRSPLQILFS